MLAAGLLRSPRHGPRWRQEIALTFDDGPAADTPAILDALAERSVRATFFVIGSQIAGRESLLRRMQIGGHEIGNHTFTHSRLAGRPWASVPEVTRASRKIREVTGSAPTVFRAPWGELTRPVGAVARACGLLPVSWDVDSGDWGDSDPESIVRSVSDAAQNGSIVLLHDGMRQRAATAAAVPAILDAVIDRGYRPVTVSGLLRLR